MEQDRIGLAEGETFVSSGLRLLLGRDARPVLSESVAAHQYDAGLDAHFAYADTDLSLFPFASLPSIAVHAGGMARVAIDPSGSAPFFFSDPLSVVDTSRVDEAGRTVYGARISVGLEPAGAALSIAELIVLRGMSLALYGDLAWAAGGAQPSQTVVGVRLRCDAALMGLKSSRFLFDAGMEDRKSVV